VSLCVSRDPRHLIPRRGTYRARKRMELARRTPAEFLRDEERGRRACRADYGCRRRLDDRPESRILTLTGARGSLVDTVAKARHESPFVTECTPAACLGVSAGPITRVRRLIDGRGPRSRGVASHIAAAPRHRLPRVLVRDRVVGAEEVPLPAPPYDVPDEDARLAQASGHGHRRIFVDARRHSPPRAGPD